MCGGRIVLLVVGFVVDSLLFLSFRFCFVFNVSMISYLHEMYVRNFVQSNVSGLVSRLCPHVL